MEGFTFRKFGKDDLAECVRFTSLTWPIVGVLEKKGNVSRLIRGYLELSLNSSTWREVVCSSGKVVGFLFGRMEAEAGFLRRVVERVGAAAIFLKLMAGRYGRLIDFPLFLEKLAATDRKVEALSPPSAGTVELFVIDPDYTGKGAGRALLDRFTRAAAASFDRKVNDLRGDGERTCWLVTLYTDSLSNWEFYERCGFSRIASFQDDIDSLLAGEETEGFIYALGWDTMKAKGDTT